jgi:hypothetical protein
MEGDLGGPVTVAALDTRVEIGVLLRHEGLGNLLVVHPPDVRHGDHGDAAEGAGVVARNQHLVEAGLVDEVVAGRDLGGDAGGVDVLLKKRRELKGLAAGHRLNMELDLQSLFGLHVT